MNMEISHYHKMNLKKILNRHLGNEFPVRHFEKKDWYTRYKNDISETNYSDYSSDIEYDFNFGKSSISILKTSFFATTSGMNCSVKYIPHSDLSLNNYLLSSFSLFQNLIKQYGFLNLFSKTLLIVGRSRDSFSPKNVPTGSISGKIAAKIYNIAPFLFTYSPEYASKLNSADRYKLILNSFKPNSISGIIGTNPFIIHKYLSDKISPRGIDNHDLCYGGLEKAYPKLKYIICLNGQPLKWHCDQLRKAFNDTVKIYDPGVGASEGIFTSGGFSNDPLGLPIVNNKSQFIEYKPLNGNSSTANYDIREFLGCLIEPIITTDYGFKRYLIGDTYRVVKYQGNYTLEFTGKKEKVFSNASERICESNVYDLMRKYSAITNIEITDYVFYFEKISGSLGRYVFVISTNDYRVKNIQRSVFNTIDVIDKVFQDINPEYKNSRLNNFILPATLKFDNNFIPMYRTKKDQFDKQEKEQIYLTPQMVQSL
jgi:hypothetical protein